MPYIYKSGLQFGINETNIYGGAEYVELTQAEYDALSDAEKHNGQIYFITDGNYDFLIVNDSVPVGSIQAYGGITVPDNWLICDGREVDRDEYAELFAAISTTYGSGDGSSTFNLPDLKGRTLIGQGSSYSLGASGGRESIVLSASIGSAYGKPATLNFKAEDRSAYQNALGTGTYSVVGSSYVGGEQWSHSTPVTEFSSASRNTNIMQPYLVTNYIIKAKNPTPTSGQHLQAMELSYPVGSYFETSDSEFDPNVEWGGAWTVKQSKIETISYISNYTLGSFKNTAANAWQYTNLSFTVPNGHFYSIRIGAGWNSGRPIGIGVNYNTTSLTGDIPAYSNENTNGVYSMSVNMLGPGTYYIFDKRATVPTLDNNVYFTAMDYVIGTSYKWHRTA